MRGAVIDLGSFTFHALVADADEHGIRNVLFDRKVAASLDDAARLDGLIADTQNRVADRCRVIATGIFRHDERARAVVSAVCAKRALELEVLDGAQEATLTWVGVSAELAGSHGVLAIIDLGGSSLALSAGKTDVDLAYGLPLGVLALRELPPAELRERVKSLASAPLEALRDRHPDTIVLASGTARALLALGRRLGVITELQRHVGGRTFIELARRLAPLSPAALHELGISAARCDSIAAGALALATVLDLLGRPVVYVARSAVREGVLVDMARRQRSSHQLIAAV